MKKKEALQVLLDLLHLSGPSGQEGPVADYLTQRLLAAGLPRNAVSRDSAHKRIPLPTSGGNLIVHLPGEGRLRRAPRRLFCAHMDSVEIVLGVKPRRRGRLILPSSGHALGADDRSGVAAVLVTLLRLIAEAPDHPPITALFTVREESGIWGVRTLEKAKLKKPAMGFNFDGGSPAVMMTAAVGSDRLDITVRGIASHGGGAPERGVNAAVVASLALAELQEKGLHGLIRSGRDRATANIGSIQGGVFHNIVCPEVSIVAETRGYRARTIDRLTTAYRRAFERAVKKVKNSEGRTGALVFRAQRLYHPFVLAARAPVVRLCRRAITACGLQPATEWSKGGLDANWLFLHGVPTVTLGAGAYNPHTTDEYLDLDQFEQALEVAWKLATLE